MTIHLATFGDMLISRPAGREAYLSAKAYVLDDRPETIVIDFDSVKVLTPSWMDEFLTHLAHDYPAVKITFLPSDNPSVAASLKIVNSRARFA